MDRAERKKTLRLIHNGLFVLTARVGDTVGAATVSWVSQCSFEPPMLMVALRVGSNVHDCLAQEAKGARFVLHVIGRGQESVARNFFSTTTLDERTINGEPFEADETGVPMIAALADRIRGKVRDVLVSGGDHDVVLLEVTDVRRGGELAPLTVAESPWEYGG